MNASTHFKILITQSLLYATLVFAQPGTIPAGGGASTTIRPDSIQNGNVYGFYMGSDAQAIAGGNLLGKIFIPGNPLMWDPVPVQVLCSGKVALTTYAAPDGGFRISGVNVNGALSVEGDAKRQMETHFEGCIVAASLTGYTSDNITLTNRNFRDAPEIGTLTLHRTENASATALSSSSENTAPKAIKAFEKARADWQTQNLDHVKDNLHLAVSIDPTFAEAWYQLGKQEQLNNPDLAREDYNKALAIDPHFVRPYAQLMTIDSQQGNWKNALADGGHALTLDPHGSAVIWYAYAEGILKAYAAGALPAAKLQLAQTSANNALTLDPQHDLPAEQLLALILTQEKKYDLALDHLSKCLAYSLKGSGADQIKQQISQVEQLKAAQPK